MNKFIKTILVLTMMTTMIVLHPTKVEAASFKMTASSTTVAPGKTFTIKVGGECIGRVNFTVTNGTISKKSVWVEQGYQTITVTAGSSGTVKVTATPAAGFSDPSGKPYSPGAKSVSVAIKEPVIKSSDNKLSSLKVSEGTLSPAFNPDTTEYTLELGASVESIKVTAKANDTKAKVSGDGDIDVTIGENMIKVTVTAENGNPKVYKIKAIVDDSPTVFVKFNEKELGVVRNLDTIPSLKGFEETTAKIEDKEINAWYSQQRDIKVVYLQDESSKDFYIVDETGKIVSKYVSINMNNQDLSFHEIKVEDQEKLGFAFTDVTILENVVKGWTFENPAFENYVLIYAMNEDGEYNYYLYEKTQGSLQIYSNQAPYLQEDIDKIVVEKEEVIKEYGQLKTYFYIALAGCGVLFLTTILGFVNASKFKKRLLTRNRPE